MPYTSLIGIQNQDLSIQYIFCSYNGELKNNGKVLLENYLERNLRIAIDQGNLLSLSDVVVECEHWHHETVDRVAKSHSDLHSFKREFLYDSSASIAYLFQVRKRRWSYMTCNHNTLRFLTPKKIRLSTEEQEES